MQKLPVIPGIVLLVAGVSLGLLWHKFGRDEVPESASQESPTALDMPAASSMPGSLGPIETMTPHVTEAAIAARSISGTPALDALGQKMESRRALTEMYPDLASTLELSSEDADKFLDMLARQQGTIFAVTGRDRIEFLERAAEGEQAALLGSKFEQWKEYRENELQRDPIDKMQNVMAPQSMGLTDEEVNPLVDALAAEQERLTRELTSAPGGRLRTSRELFQLQVPRAAADNQKLVQVASRYLNGQQLEVYQRLLRQRQIGMERKLRAMERAGEQDEN